MSKMIISKLQGKLIITTVITIPSKIRNLQSRAIKGFHQVKKASKAKENTTQQIKNQQKN